MKSFLLAIFLPVIILFSVSLKVEGTVIGFDDHGVGPLDPGFYLPYDVFFSPGGVVTPESTTGRVALSMTGALTADFLTNEASSVSVDYYFNPNDPDKVLTLQGIDNMGNTHITQTNIQGTWDTFALSTTGWFTEISVFNGGGEFVVDNITFPADESGSGAVVPEASTMTLFASCLMGLTYVRRKVS